MGREDVPSGSDPRQITEGMTLSWVVGGGQGGNAMRLRVAMGRARQGRTKGGAWHTAGTVPGLGTGSEIRLADLITTCHPPTTRTCILHGGKRFTWLIQMSCNQNMTHDYPKVANEHQC